jgi:hypothetical protein
MKIGVISVLLSVALPVMWSQAPPAAGPSQQIAALKQSMAENKARLARYQWIQSTEINVKGKTRKDVQNACHYGPDGKVVKTPMGPPPDAPPAAEAPQGGRLKSKVIAKKKEEFQDFGEQLKSLISNYAPPDAEQLKAARQAGNAGMAASNGVATLTFNDYYKPGDKVVFSFDTAAKKLVSYNVNTYLSDPNTDVVTLTNKFASLPDGTNYLQQTVLNSKSKEIQITTTNSNYTPATQ